jgi:hypothetical protein
MGKTSDDETVHLEVFLYVMRLMEIAVGGIEG